MVVEILYKNRKRVAKSNDKNLVGFPFNQVKNKQ